MRFVYLLVSYLLAPFVLGFLLWRGLRNRAYWDRLPERFGFCTATFDAPCIWVHAVSVGEVQAAAALIRELLRRHPEIDVLVTTVTPTGASRVVDIFGDEVAHCYAPYDLPGAVRRFFDRISPRVAIIIETELWPNLYNECGIRNVPLILASARISPRSVSKYRRFVALFREALSHGIVIAAQSSQDAERFRSLGAAPERTHTTGNIKFDFELEPDTATRGAELRARHAPDRPVLIAASTHDNEERIVLRAFERVRSSLPDCLLILVPRHPERFGQVAALLRDRRVPFVTRTSGGHCQPETRVLLVDTLGELPIFYAASDVAFVGGSLVPIGGHNLLEPAALGVPILTGKHQFNTEDIARLLIECGAASVVDDAEELADRAAELLVDPERRARAGAAGLRVVRENRGALGRLLALIDPILIGQSEYQQGQKITD